MMIVGQVNCLACVADSNYRGHSKFIPTHFSLSSSLCFHLEESFQLHMAKKFRVHPNAGRGVATGAYKSPCMLQVYLLDTCDSKESEKHSVRLELGTLLED